MSDILLILEGAKTDKILFERLLSVYNIQNHNIYTYNTNIYSLYNQLTKKGYVEDDQIDFDSISLPLLLNEIFNNEQTKKISQMIFSDIILVFDFDPQDSNYDYTKLFNLQKGFNDSTDKGQLYINYPMIESIKHHTSIPSDVTDFFNLEIDFKVVKEKKYKAQIGNLTCISDFKKITKEQFNFLISLHRNKMDYLNSTYLSKWLLEQHDDNFLNLLSLENFHLDTNQKIFVQNTCIFYILDYNPNLIGKKL
ncbi:hypothetical protein [Carnobacterium maltaromaticum]|uniref:hypothetical protein n=1 Tax=Carnobacterium maltaromaticum TaxID=2751 RepID=UPI00191B910A|nr:hypothetical protein [Carnobacterium maltaromaticum]CAD5897900.1 conserved hypothetical protein [Carnobacterium maltaromaticum]